MNSMSVAAIWLVSSRHDLVTHLLADTIALTGHAVVVLIVIITLHRRARLGRKSLNHEEGVICHALEELAQDEVDRLDEIPRTVAFRKARLVVQDAAEQIQGGDLLG